MSEKRFRTNDLVKFDYSEIGEYVDENHTPTPLRNDEVCKLLNEQEATIQRFEEYVFSDERILCYNCLFCQEKDIYEVKCKIKGSVDVHGTCQYYEKKGGDGI